MRGPLFWCPYNKILLFRVVYQGSLFPETPLPILFRSLERLLKGTGTLRFIVFGLRLSALTIWVVVNGPFLGTLNIRCRIIVRT